MWYMYIHQSIRRLIANFQPLVKVTPLDKYSVYMTFTCAHLINDDFALKRSCLTSGSKCNGDMVYKGMISYYSSGDIYVGDLLT